FLFKMVDDCNRIQQDLCNLCSCRGFRRFDTAACDSAEIKWRRWIFECHTKIPGRSCRNSDCLLWDNAERNKTYPSKIDTIITDFKTAIFRFAGYSKRRP